MALSGLLSQGLLSRTAGSRFERSYSCGDLDPIPCGSKDPLQMFASVPGRSQCRSLSSEAPSPANAKIPPFHRDLSNGIVESSQGSEAKSMRYVLSLSDILQGSIATGSCEYLSLEFYPKVAMLPVDSIPEECECQGMSERSDFFDLNQSQTLDDEFAEEDSLLDDVMEGLVSGHSPELTEEGTGGTYFLSNPQGQKVAVFKPMDEEPLALNCPRGMPPSSTGEGLKKGTRVGEGAFREVAAHILDYPAEGEESGFAGVPLTFLAECGSEHFHSPASFPVLPQGSTDAVKLGSLQQFVPSMNNCEDMGPKHFSAQEVHKIAVLDMRLANTDRNGANILVQENQTGFHLTPIDHGYCLPETLEDLTFEWLYWQQAKRPFDQRTLQYIESLDSSEDIDRLQAHGWEVNPAVARTMHVCTMLLKKGASRGLTPFDIGSLMVREDFNRPSALESWIEEAEARIDREGLSHSAFFQILSSFMDAELASPDKSH